MPKGDILGLEADRNMPSIAKVSNSCREPNIGVCWGGGGVLAGGEFTVSFSSKYISLTFGLVTYRSNVAYWKAAIPAIICLAEMLFRI